MPSDPIIRSLGIRSRIDEVGGSNFAKCILIPMRGKATHQGVNHARSKNKTNG